jgi:hypothetical protein
MEPDPLIQLLKNRLDILILLGKMWDILYMEGSTPDIGIRRQHLIRIMLEEELGLKVTQSAPLEREWDLSIIINGKEIRYSLNTMERIGTLKVAWNGFPSIERARRFQFRYPILYVSGSRKDRRISIYVFDVNDLEELREKSGDSIWWIPKDITNPRGFGIKVNALRILMDMAREKGNHVEATYNPVDLSLIETRYWRLWYKMLKELIIWHNTN